MNWTILNYFFFFCFSVLLQTESLLGNEVTFAGTVSPSGNYKIVISDYKNRNASEECQDLFGDVKKKVRTCDHKTKKEANNEIKLSLLKYNEELKLEDLNECFEYFYSVQTNDEGKFEIKMSNDVKPIYVHIFPLDKQKKLIPSTFEHGFFSQNRYRYKKWKDFVKQKDELYFLHHSEQEERVRHLLSEWIKPNEVPSDEAAFLLEAYFDDITKKLSEKITTTKTLHLTEKLIFNNYGSAFLACHDNYEKKFTEKLAQIGVTEKMLKQICQFLRYDDKIFVIKSIDKDLKMALPHWQIFCPKFMANTMSKQSLVGMGNLNSVETDDMNEKLIPSSFERGFFSQNRYRDQNWKNFVKPKEQLHFLHNSKEEERVRQLLNEWSKPNGVPSDEAAFLLEVYFHDVTKKLSEQITTTKKMYLNELQIFNNYGIAFLACIDNGINFTEKLAQIGVNEKMLAHICHFLGYDNKIFVLKPIDNDLKNEFPDWKEFCPKFMGKKMPKLSLVMGSLNSVETDGMNEDVKKFVPKEQRQKVKEKETTKASTKTVQSRVGTGVF